jgi:hypothetical protein
MLPKFHNWIENLDGNPSSLSEPEHKKGEESLTLNKLIEKRMKEMIEEFQSKGKATPEQVVDSIKYFLGKNSPQDQNQNQPPQNQAQAQPQDQAQGQMPQNIS